MLTTKARFIKVSFQSWAFQYPRCYKAFRFQNEDDLCNRPFRNLFPELDRLFQKKIEIVRKSLGSVFLPVCRFETRELAFCICFLITVKRTDLDVILLCDLSAQLQTFRVIHIFP